MIRKLSFFCGSGISGRPGALAYCATVRVDLGVTFGALGDRNSSPLTGAARQDCRVFQGCESASPGAQCHSGQTVERFLTLTLYIDPWLI
jgi:hypothetical protein